MDELYPNIYHNSFFMKYEKYNLKTIRSPHYKYEATLAFPSCK